MRMIWMVPVIAIALVLIPWQATMAADAATSLRFEVPFPAMLTRKLDMAPLPMNASATDSNAGDYDQQRIRSSRQDDQLYVARVLTQDRNDPDEGTETCTASVAEDGQEAESCVVANVPTFPLIQATDRLVAVDGEPISLLSFQEVIALPVGTVVVLPLFTAIPPRRSQMTTDPSSSLSSASTPDPSGNLLSGFARIEILRPKNVAFEPTTAERRSQVLNWQTALANWHREQEQLAQQEQARQATAALSEQEEADRVRREKEEMHRLEMTAHTHIPSKRVDGREFRYEVEFTTMGPIGINWDLHVTDRTVVSYLEPKLAAHRLNVIAPGDQLVELNEVDTSAMGPYEVVQTYQQTTAPRRLVFRSALNAERVAKSAKQNGGSASKDSTALGTSLASTAQVQNWTLTFEQPEILRGWHSRLHLANWSEVPAFVNRTTELVMATPIMACQPQPPVSSGSSASKDFPDDMASPTSNSNAVIVLAYRGACSFVDKAQHVANSGAQAIIIVNNANGDGRFPKAANMVDIERVEIPVNMISKLDGELVMAVLEHEPVHVFVHEEHVTQVIGPLKPPPKLTNAEMTLRRDPIKSARSLTFWYINATSPSAPLQESASSTFRILPALFGNNITTTPYRIVMAYPQDTACHPQGLGIHGAHAVVLVKRGGCSFGAKASTVQAVGGAGMILINSDDSLLPLMSDPRETKDLTIWAASIGSQDGAMIQTILVRNKNLPSLVKAHRLPNTEDSGSSAPPPSS